MDKKVDFGKRFLKCFRGRRAPVRITLENASQS